MHIDPDPNHERFHDQLLRNSLKLSEIIMIDDDSFTKILQKDAYLCA